MHPTDSNVFWVGLFAAPVIWTFLAFAALLSFKFMYFLLVGVALGLSLINAIVSGPRASAKAPTLPLRALSRPHALALALPRVARPSHRR